jgi:WD40 repeat protein
MSNPIHAQESSVEPAPWVQHVEPGVRLVGQTNFVGLQLPQSSYWDRAWTPDGKFLLGVVGRQLLVIDWDRREIVRRVELPIQPGSSTVDYLLWSPDGQLVVLLLRWYGESRPPDGIDESAADAPLESDAIDWQTSGQRLLAYDQNWNLKHDWEMVDRLAEVQGYSLLHPGYILSDNQTLLLFCERTPQDRLVTGFSVSEPEVIAFDMKQGHVATRQMGVRMGSMISAHELIPARNSQVWDIRKNEVFPVDTLGVPKARMVHGADATGTHFVLYDPQRQNNVVWNRQTGKQTPLVGIHSPNAWGIFSSDGRFCLVTDVDFSNQSMPVTRIIVYDTKSEEFVANAKLSEVLRRVVFRPGHHSLVVGSINDSTLLEVPVDKDLPISLERALNRLPIRGELAYADQDRILVLRGNHSYLTTDQHARVTQRHSYNLDRSVYSPTKPQRIRIRPDSLQDVESGNWNDENLKRLYNIEANATLGALKTFFGVPDQKPVYVAKVYLGFDPTGDLIWNIFIENEGALRLRVSQADSGRRISETRLEVKFDPRSATYGSVSADGLRVAIINQRDLTILNAESGQIIRGFEIASQVEHLALDRGGDFVAVARGKRYWKSGDEVFLDQLHVYSVASGEVVWSETNRDIKGFGFQPGTDRLYVLTSGRENELRFFDRDTWQETWRHATSHAPAYGMAMSSTGHEIAIGLRDSRVEFWKLSEIQTR